MAVRLQQSFGFFGVKFCGDDQHRMASLILIKTFFDLRQGPVSLAALI
jgi:hypothetical protein